MQYTLITGACGGLGGAFTKILAQTKTPLFLSGRSAERLETLKKSLGNVPVEVCSCDLRDEAGRAAFFACADSRNAAFTRLIYVAGVDTQMAFEKYDEAHILTQARVNFEGAVSFIRSVLQRAPLDGNTEILVIGSVTSIMPEPYFALYAATKKALEYFAAALRVELKGRAKVTCVLPGGMPTRADIKENIKAHGGYGALSAMPPEKVAKISLAAVKKNKRRKIIGFWNKLTNFGAALLPLSWRMYFAAKVWKNTEKDFYKEN